MIYLDTSALTKLIEPEPETLARYQWLAEGPDSWVASVLVQVELVRVVRRTDPAALATALGVLDAIQLATALEIGEVTAFVTYDQRPRAAAEAHELPTAAPS